MFKTVSRIVALTAAILAAGVASAAGQDVLYWMIDDSATVNKWWVGEEVGIKDFFGTPPEGSASLAPWTPMQFTAVPEPSSGLLALLALRRNRLAEEV